MTNYIVGFSILGAEAVLMLLGVMKDARKDFKLNEWLIFGFAALVIGLDFVPAAVWGGFSFRVGTMILLVAALALHFVGGRGVNLVFTLLLTVIMTGVIYGVTRLAYMFGGQTMWSDVNWVYALVTGLVCFLFTRNAKYGFVSGVVSAFAAHVLASIGMGGISLEPAFSPAVVAGGFAIFLYSLVKMFVPSRPSKTAYYFEAGRLED